MTGPRFRPYFRYLAALAIGAVAAATAHAADVTYAVNTTDDRIDNDTDDGICNTSVGTCSLRAAIMQANHRLDPGIATITVPAGVYRITRAVNGANGEDSGDLNLTPPNSASQLIAILGAGVQRTFIDGNQLDGVFAIDLARAAGIRGVTIRNGARRPTIPGGGILNRGSLSVFDSQIVSNYTDENGGGIYNEGLLNVVRTSIDVNTAEKNGGGIYNSGTLGVTSSSFKSNFCNQLGFGGGGIFNSGQTRVRGSTLDFNNATAGNGGGIFNSGQLIVVNSTLSANSANAYGGGIFNFSKTFLYNATVISNTADAASAVSVARGGGIYAEPASGNRVVAVNTLIASNNLRGGATLSDCNGTIEVYGYNLLSDFSGCQLSGNGAPAAGSVTRSTLGLLQDNGGPTETHALLLFSEAIDSTQAQGCLDDTGAVLTTDQRGAPRSVYARCDVGAYEFGGVVPLPDAIFKHGFE